jgi:mono/diheme cytochrome c family protein
MRFALRDIVDRVVLVALVLASPWSGYRAAADDGAAAVTFNKHVAPILWKNCASCHRPGEVGPFSLLSYADASKRADFLVEMTASRRMPPWKAEPSFGQFHDERRLSDDDLALIAAWAKAGAPEGDAQDLPELPKFSEGWQLGEPDLVVKMEKPFEVPSDGSDLYRCFVIPLGLEKDRMVSAVEFRPGNRAVVHHAIMFLDATGAGRKRDAEDEQQGFVSFGGPGITPTGGLGGWAPGATPRFLPDGIVKYVKQGSDLVLQLHYHPSGKPEQDQSTVGIYFSKKPTKKIVTGIALAQPGMKLPAGQADCVVEVKSLPLPAEVQVLGISPHMHNLGKSMKVTAKTPDTEEEVPLIWIKDWDFNWQGQYQFAKPVRLPKGAVIQVHAVYDNSAENPKNPNNPPKEVRWGEATQDEMCLCGVQVFTDKQSDLKLIAAMPGNELGKGLDGGIPGQAEVIKRAATRKAATGKPREKPGAGGEALAEQLTDRAAPQAKGGIPDDGVAIPEDKKRLLKRFDLDGDGKLTRKEINKMPSGMQGYVVRHLVKGGG